MQSKSNPRAAECDPAPQNEYENEGDKKTDYIKRTFQFIYHWSLELEVTAILLQ